MRQQFSDRLEPFLAFHRGIGADNTLKSLQAGIDESPYLQEFDVQRYTRLQYFLGRISGREAPDFDYRTDLALGHPPEANLDESLSDALTAFTGSDVLPKIDVKPQWWQLDHYKTVDIMLNAIKNFEQPILINISGSPRNVPFIKPKPAAFMELERYVSRHAPDETMINLDLERFGDLSDSAISRHIDILREGSTDRVHSFSPIIDDTEGVKRSAKLAIDHGITNLHFWGKKSSSYQEIDLIELAEKYTDMGLHAVIDIDLDTIVPIA